LVVFIVGPDVSVLRASLMMGAVGVAFLEGAVLDGA
jgi:hypothetical protein